jgi:hypothetical protein
MNSAPRYFGIEVLAPANSAELVMAHSIPLPPPRYFCLRQNVC